MLSRALNHPPMDPARCPVCAASNVREDGQLCQHPAQHAEEHRHQPAARFKRLAGLHTAVHASCLGVQPRGQAACWVIRSVAVQQ